MARACTVACKGDWGTPGCGKDGTAEAAGRRESPGGFCVAECQKPNLASHGYYSKYEYI